MKTSELWLNRTYMNEIQPASITTTMICRPKEITTPEQDNEWRYLVQGDYLDTPEWFRHSGVEVAEPGAQKGTVLIHHCYEGYNEIKEERIVEIRDTIVKPTYNKIKD